MTGTFGKIGRVLQRAAAPAEEVVARAGRHNVNVNGLSHAEGPFSFLGGARHGQTVLGGGIAPHYSPEFIAANPLPVTERGFSLGGSVTPLTKDPMAGEKLRRARRIPNAINSSMDNIEAGINAQRRSGGWDAFRKQERAINRNISAREIGPKWDPVEAAISRGNASPINGGPHVYPQSPRELRAKQLAQGNYFSEAGEGWKGKLGMLANGAIEGLSAANRMSLTKAVSPALVGALGGGAISGLGSVMFPNNVEYQGMVSPFFKGAITGAALGAAHGAMGRAVRTNAFKGMTHDALAATNTFVTNNRGFMYGAIGVATAASTGESHFTRPIN